MNTISLVVSRMALGGAISSTVGIVSQLACANFGIATFFAILTGVLLLIAIGFQVAYNRFQYQLRNMAQTEEQEGRVLHVYSRSDVGGPG